MAGKVHVPVVGTTGKVIRPGGTTRVTTPAAAPATPAPSGTLNIGSLLRDLTGQIRDTQLFRDLADRIDLIDADAVVEGSVAWQVAQEAAARATALTDLSNTLQAEIDAVIADVADLSGLPDFDEDVAYDVDDIVKYSGGLYRCILATSVPSPVPTNETYWEKIGDYASLGEAVAALAAQYTTLDTLVSGLDGDVTSLTSRTTALESSVGTLEDDIVTKAAITYVDTAISTEQSARSTAISNLQSTLQGNIDAKASISQLNQAVADIYSAEVTAFTNIDAEFDSVDSAIATKASSTDLTTAVANIYGAAVSSFTNIAAEFDSVDSALSAKASITQLNDAKAEIYGAEVSQFTQIQAAFDEFDPDLSSYATITALNAAIADVYGAAVSSFTQINTRFSNTDAAISSKASMTQLNEAKSDIWGSDVIQFTNISAEFERVDEDITDLDAAQTTALNAAVSTLNTAIANAESGAVATATQQVYTTLGGNQAAVETKAESWDGTAAQWSVKTTVGDLVGGVGLYNDGEETLFLVQADKFAVYGSTLPGNLDDIIPFVVTGGATYIKEAFIQELSADKITAGTIDAQITMTDNLILSTAGRIYTAGKTSIANSTAGVFLGHDGGSNYDFAVGNNTRNMKWDGSAGTLEVNGTVVGSGVFTNGVLTPESFRILAPGTSNTCPPIISDFATNAHASGTQTITSRTASLYSFYSPAFGSGHSHKRLCYNKMDVILEGSFVTHSINAYTIQFQYSTNGGTTWSNILSHTFNGNNTRAHQTARIRYTTPSSWNTLAFRLIVPNCSYVQLVASVSNWAESSYTANTVSDITGVEELPPLPPPPYDGPIP